MPTPSEPLERRTWAAERLFEEHPPLIRDPNERVVLEIACPQGAKHGGEAAFTRWSRMPMPEALSPKASGAQRPGSSRRP